MVRCGQNRSEMKYESECVNAREAINRLERAEERARRAELEAQSERKRQALRRTQEAAAAARRRALEEQRRREEAEYLGIFDDGVQGQPADQSANTAPMSGNAPGAVVDAAPEPEVVADPVIEPAPAVGNETTEGQVAPAESSNLEQVREELRKRQQATDETGN